MKDHDEKPAKTLESILRACKAAVPYAAGIAAGAATVACLKLWETALFTRLYFDRLNIFKFEPTTMDIEEFKDYLLSQHADEISLYSTPMLALAFYGAAMLTTASVKHVMDQRKERRNKAVHDKLMPYRPSTTRPTTRLTARISERPFQEKLQKGIDALCTRPWIPTAAITAYYAMTTPIAEQDYRLLAAEYERCSSLIEQQQLSSFSLEQCTTIMDWAAAQVLYNMVTFGVTTVLMYPLIKDLATFVGFLAHSHNRPVFTLLPAYESLRAGKREKALKQLSAVQQKRRRWDDPDTQSHQQLLEGILYLGLGMEDEALKRISSAVEIASTLPEGEQFKIPIPKMDLGLVKYVQQKLGREKAVSYWEFMGYLLNPNRQDAIERELNKLESTGHNNLTVLFLKYQLYAAQGREDDVVRVLEQVIDHVHEQSGLHVFGSIVRHQSEYLRWQFATKVGNETGLRIEFRHTKELQELAASVPGMSVATPVAIVTSNGVPYYFMKLERGQELASVTSGKQKLLEIAARFNGAYHALVEPPMPPIEYGEQLQERIFENGLFTRDARKRLITAIEAIKQAYPSRHHVAQRDGHQQNYIVVANDEYAVSGYSGDGKEHQPRLVAIDFGFSKGYRPEIDLVKLLEMGEGDVDGIRRDHVIAAYAEGFHDASPWSPVEISQEQLILRETALTPLVFLSYACWGIGKPEAASMMQVFHGNALQSIERMRTVFPTDYRRLKPAYDVLEEEIRKLSCPPLSTPSGSTGLSG